jgi:hypothetical protein
MEEIAKIPYTELIRDRDESVADISVCETALSLGITTYGDGKSTQRRLEVNQGVVEKIDAELARRKQAAAAADTPKRTA